MKKLALILTCIVLNGCAVFDTIDTDSYVQYIETGRSQQFFKVKKVSETHNKKLAKWNYVIFDSNDKVKLFWNTKFEVGDSIYITKIPLAMSIRLSKGNVAKADRQKMYNELKREFGGEK
jgi:hypothetical protein